jgi:hypothetical protein
MTKAARKPKSTGNETAGMTGLGNLLTAGKLAVAWGVKPAEVKKAIAAAGVRPDASRCGCAYYSRAAAASIKKHLAKG